MNDYDNCRHNFEHNDERCGMCTAAGMDQFPGWEEEESTADILEMDVPITTLPEYIASAGELGHKSDRYLCTKCSHVTEFPASKHNVLAISCDKCESRADLLREDGSKAMHPVATAVTDSTVSQLTMDEYCSKMAAAIDKMTEKRLVSELLLEAVGGEFSIDRSLSGARIHLGSLPFDTELSVDGLTVYPSEAHRIVMELGSLNENHGERIMLSRALMRALEYYNEHKELVRT